MSNVSGPGSVSPSDMVKYKEEFQKSVSIFQESLDGYATTDGMGKKEMFRKAMSESLNVMDQLSPIFSKEIQKQKEALHNDLSSYQEAASPEGLNKLHSDIDSLKKSLK